MNEIIRQAREAGLAVLKPSQRDLERGLELHSNALVIESYGFSPRSAVDGGAVRAAVEAGASEIEIEDMLEDMSMTRCATDPFEREEYLSAWDASGVTCIFQNAGEEGNALSRLIKRLARFTYVTDMMRGQVSKAVTPDDILAARRENRRCLYLTGNGVPLPQDWISVEEELRYIRVFFQLGCRMMHLTYNRRNMIGDGCAEPADAGLSDFGRAVVAEMNRVGVLVDVAHSGFQSCLDAAAASSRPIVISHSACHALNAHYRCKPDAVIRAVADTGGYMGVCCIPAFLGGSGDIAAVLDHIDYIVRHFGPDCAAIGTDIVYSSTASDREYEKIPPRRRSRSGWDHFWPDPSPSVPHPLSQDHPSLAWTNWPLFTVGLVQRGHSDETIQKILGGNVLRVARAVWPGG